MITISVPLNATWPQNPVPPLKVTTNMAKELLYEMREANGLELHDPFLIKAKELVKGWNIHSDWHCLYNLAMRLDTNPARDWIKKYTKQLLGNNYCGLDELRDKGLNQYSVEIYIWGYLANTYKLHNNDSDEELELI